MIHFFHTCHYPACPGNPNRHFWIARIKRAMTVLLMTLALFPIYAIAAYENPTPIPRKLLALYDSREYEGHNIRQNMIHQHYEMPANRLGYDVFYHDINEPLPELNDEYRGVLIGLFREVAIDQPAYLVWLEKQLNEGRHIVLLGDVGIYDWGGLDDASKGRLKFIYERIGIKQFLDWHPLTHRSRIASIDETMLGFERKLAPPFPPFQAMKVSKAGTSHLKMLVSVDRPKETADLIITGPQGGFVTSEYDFHSQEIKDRYVTSWYLNPFHFLKTALNAPTFPIPDITTHNGRRIFYSHIDGDGWNNPTRIEGYPKGLVSSAEVIQDKLLKPYDDFSFSVGLVAADLVDHCFGSEKSREIARSTLALPNVEPTNHTYTHPLFWQFFEEYTAEREAPFTSAYPKRAGMFANSFGAVMGEHNHPKNSPILKEKRERLRNRSRTAPDEKILTIDEIMLEFYDTPRSYNCMPFSEETEIVDSLKLIQTLSPSHKKVGLMQWSGNTSPYERFVRKVREAGMLNINGGESRFDAEYPSYSSIFPIGVKVGNEQQIYSTASNENTYTNLWSERFFGYRYLIETVRRTEEPIRIAPFNVYFHSYSGERPASLRALIEIMDYARGQELIPLFTSRFSAIANGFFSTDIEILGETRWRIRNRGEMQTFRIEGAADQHIDHSASNGVLGYRSYQGSLYVFLNPSIDNAVIALSETPTPALSLVSSRFDIREAKRDTNDAITLTMEGVGEGEMLWRVPQDGRYEVKTAQGSPLYLESHRGEITIPLPKSDPFSPFTLSIRFASE